MQKLRDQLVRGLKSLNIDIPSAIIDKLLQYIQILHKWNKVYNLTAIDDLSDMVVYHLLDSLSITPYVRGKRVIDVGTGAGLPGLPLALTMPDKQFTLVDSNGKKIRFLRFLCQELGITNVDVVQERVEKLNQEQCYESVISRAFASLEDMLENTQHLCCDDGSFLAMKGRYPSDEINNINCQFQLQDVVKLQIPGLEAQRHLIIVTKK